jgi:quercetin dioxygenase-like cupin family protein
MTSSSDQSKGSWTLAGSESIKSPIEGTRRYRASDAPWEPTELDGFWIKSLYEDPVLGEKTMLMKVDPGAYAPSHTHPGEFEQVFVLEGSFYDQDGTMVAGDYCCRAPDAAHSAGSKEGALVMLVYTKRAKATKRTSRRELRS